MVRYFAHLIIKPKLRFINHHQLIMTYLWILMMKHFICFWQKVQWLMVKSISMRLKQCHLILYHYFWRVLRKLLWTKHLSVQIIIHTCLIQILMHVGIQKVVLVWKKAALNQRTVIHGWVMWELMQIHTTLNFIPKKNLMCLQPLTKKRVWDLLQP